MAAHIIVWDLETIPDVEGYAAANSLTDKSIEDIRALMGDKFPKHIYHSIVCIGVVIAERTDEGWRVSSIGAPHVGERSEKNLITSFVNKIADLRPQLVTFNGSAFDLPVVRYRAMIHKVSAPGLSARNYFNRYSQDALDLCDELSSFGASAKVKLDEISKILGLPGKPSEIDGSQVEDYFKAGKIAEISKYCECDVINTYRVFLRYELFRGHLSETEFETSEANLTAFELNRQ